jgi:hypothetical protein
LGSRRSQPGLPSAALIKPHQPSPALIKPPSFWQLTTALLQQLSTALVLEQLSTALVLGRLSTALVLERLSTALVRRVPQPGPQPAVVAWA